MGRIDLIANFILVLHALPHRNAAVAHKAPTSRRVNALGPGPDFLNDATQAFTDVARRMRRGLPDVNLPSVVELIRHVDSDSREFRKFHLARQTEPCAVND